MAENRVMNLQFALLGTSGVGKTSLFERFISQRNVNTESTISPVVKTKTILMNHLGQDVKVKLTVWDTAGMEKFQPLMPQYYRATHGFIIVYDVTSKLSFESLERVFTDADTFATIQDYAKIVVGNKIDLVKNRAVPRADGMQYAHSKGALFIEASAKTNDAVDHIFEKLATHILASSNIWRKARSEDTTKLQNPSEQNTPSQCHC